VRSGAPRAAGGSEDTHLPPFSQAAQHVVDARVYLGIHFRFADVEARAQGRRVAEWVFGHFLLPLRDERHHH